MTETKTTSLPRGTELDDTAPGILTIVKNRKSRIIMKDGEKILSLADELRRDHPGKEIRFRTSAPVCSKTKRFLENNGVGVE